MDVGDPWSLRLERLLSRLEAQCTPTIVLVESRSGLHDVAAATVTDLDAQVMLFAADSDAIPSCGDSDNAFSFDLDDDWAPHHPIAIHWSRGLAAGTSLRALEPTVVPQAYAGFLRWFDDLIGRDGEEAP